MKTEKERLVRDLAELNEGFLEFVARGGSAGLPDDVARRLRNMAPDARRRLAAAPFALFGFGFEDEAAWARLLSSGVRDLEPAYVSREPLAERFTLLALAALRGFVGAAPHSVSAWIGLPAATRARLAEVEICALATVAARAAPRLCGRFQARQDLWRRIIDAAERSDERHLRLLIALGKQWTIRRCLGLGAGCTPARGFRR
jgi:hypothetical protein